MAQPLSICIVDDNIPAAKIGWMDDSTSICKNCLKFLVEFGNWDEPEIKELTTALLAKEETWTVSGFTSPEIFLNVFGEKFPPPDVLIYDWEYSAGSDTSDVLLLEILNLCHSYVAVYSGSAHQHKIEEALGNSKFDPFKGRLDIFSKEESDSSTLLGKVQGHLETNFSGKFSRRFRKETKNAVESVLVEIGKHSLKNVIEAFGRDQDSLMDEVAGSVSGKMVSALDQVDISDVKDEAERNATGCLFATLPPVLRQRFSRFRNDQFLGDGVCDDEQANTDTETLLKSLVPLWRFRLYHETSDKRVKTGDVVKLANGKHALVVTHSCDLARFWYKTLGSVSVIPLLVSSKDKELITEKSRLRKSPSGMKAKVGVSFTANFDGGWPDSVFGLPFIIEDDESLLLLGFPKEIYSIAIEKPSADFSKRDAKKTPLYYSNWNGTDRIVQIAEPFASQLIQKAVASIVGYGVPDYPSIVKDKVENLHKKIHD